MQQIERIDIDQVDSDVALCFSLPVLRSGPVLPLKSPEPDYILVAVSEDGRWPWVLLDDIRRESGRKVVPVLAPEEQIVRELNRVFDMASASAEEMLEDLAVDDLGKEIEQVQDLLESDDTAPAIRLVNTLISQALKEHASDIHVEPYEQYLSVRFRVDGFLYSVVSTPKKIQTPLITRIKVLARMNIAEKRRPQDGRFRVKVAGREVDIRVSTLPTAYGERVVMRLLDRGQQLFSLEQLGMSPQHLEIVRKALGSPHGIVLVTGPTGSGKTTTLYSALMQVDRHNRNVLTIEDPIEYQLDGVAQMQVQPSIGVDFAAGLRSILRQDPDIVMVGEMRDRETAEIAVQASLTGHLVFSTLHTNDAISAIPRLLDLGVEAYLIASSLLLVQAQRLVRKLCPDCKRPRQVEESDWLALGVDPKFFPVPDVMYEAVGCDACFHSGYRGRIGIFEMFMVSSSMRNLIHGRDGLLKMRQLALQEGMVTLAQDGARHVASGVTSIDEVLRVTRQDSVVVDT